MVLKWRLVVSSLNSYSTLFIHLVNDSTVESNSLDVSGIGFLASVKLLDQNC